MRHLFPVIAMILAFVMANKGATARDLLFTTGDWKPYINVVNHAIPATSPGFSVEIVNAVFERYGYQITYQTAPFKRQIQQTASMTGVFDGLVGLYRRESRAMIFPNEPIGLSQNCFYVQAGTAWRYTKPENLRDVKIAIIDGYDYGTIDAELKKGRPKLLGDESTMMPRMIGLLQSGRVDAFLQDSLVTGRYLSEHDLDNAVPSAGCLMPDELVLGLSPRLVDAQQLADQFDDGVRQMRQSGALARILAAYNIEDWADRREQTAPMQ